MPKRINRTIELLEQGQPIYYTGSHTGAVLTYEAGRDMAKTWADYINIGMEHGCFDMTGLAEFMRGLVDGGPTNSGHRTPAVIVEAPVDGGSEDVIRANAWQFQQILARGAHGILLCNAETPEAVTAFVESCRYPCNTIGEGPKLREGRRGTGGQPSAAPIWGVSVQEYVEKADPWPLNPNGELMLGLKIENKRALLNAELSLKVPGIAFAEPGPGDMSMSFGYKTRPTDPVPPELQAAHDRIFAACKAEGIHFLHGGTIDTIEDRIREGVMISSTAASGPEMAVRGRAFTKRTMPV